MMATFAVWLLILLPQQPIAAPRNDTAHQQIGTPSDVAIHEKGHQPDIKHNGRDDQQRYSPSAPQPPRTPPSPRWREHPLRRFMSLSDTDKIAFALLGVTTLYLIATVGILVAMLMSNRHAAETSKSDNEHTQESLRLTREGQVETRRATSILEGQLSIATNIARAWLSLANFITPPFAKFAEASTYVRIEVVNTGQTPAFNLDVLAFAAYGDVIPEFPEDTESSPLESIGGFLGAGKITEIHVEMIKLKPDEMCAVRNGDDFLYMLGRIGYDDIFGKRRLTTFSVVYMPELHGWRVGPKYNHQS